MTELEKYNQLKAYSRKLQLQLAAEMHGRLIPTKRAVRLQKDLDQTEKTLSQMYRDTVERARMREVPMDQMLEIVAIPLVADVLNDLVAGINKTMRDHGLQETVFGEAAKRIQRDAVTIYSTLDALEEQLPEITCDDTLVEALKKKTLSFIKQRMKRKAASSKS